MYDTFYVYPINQNHYFCIKEIANQTYSSVEQYDGNDINQFFCDMQYVVIPNNKIGIYDKFIYVNFDRYVYRINAANSTFQLMYNDVADICFCDNSISVLLKRSGRKDQIRIFDPNDDTDIFIDYMQNHNFDR